MDCSQEIERIRRVSDMLATAHANLRERYSHRAVILDVAVLALSTWLVSVVFVEPRINLKLTPSGIDPQIWVGLLGILTFFLSIVQLRVDWKRRSDAHKRSFDMYTQVKRECVYLLTSGKEINTDSCQRALARYDMAVDVGAPIPEGEFLAQKRNHVKKVAISKHLDNHPGTSILLIKLKMWWRDNIHSY
jgi:hypothetical protein